MTKELEIVCNFINQAKAKYPDATLYRDGDIQYCNGNDGTDFDWECNDRLCEFGCGNADNSVWAFKCHVYKDGSATIYCYPNGEMKPVETIKKEYLLSDYELENLYEHLYYDYDLEGNYDCFLKDIETN